jgi:hypothetical protein
MNERPDALREVGVSRAGCRCSDMGFLSLTLPDDLTSQDWTDRRLATEIPGGATSIDALPIFARLLVEPQTGCESVGDFGRPFNTMAGRRQTTLDNDLAGDSH